MIKYLLGFIGLLVCCSAAVAQPYTVSGKVITVHGLPAAQAAVALTAVGAKPITAAADTGGYILIGQLSAGHYYISIAYAGSATYADSFRITNKNVDLGLVVLLPADHMLPEVKVTEKAPAVRQNGDTVEYSSGAYKTNPDADAADLVRKMPGIDIADKKVTAHGESVVKVTVDGKPFFGDDPIATLKNIPAEMIAKVQVYNEKTEQEKFTGFSEGPTAKTINIVTKPDKKKGVFGNIYAGGGGDRTVYARYGAGYSLSSFGTKRRITLTGQANNVNAQNFTESNPSGGGSGNTATRAAGINYTDSLGRKGEISGSYAFSHVATVSDVQMHKAFFTAADSGLVYNETRPTDALSTAHRLNLRINYYFDSLNSLLWQPSASINIADGSSVRQGATSRGIAQVNSIYSRNSSDRTSLSMAGSLLYRHLFAGKKGRTLSANLNLNQNSSESVALQHAENVYYASPWLSGTLKQQTAAMQTTTTTEANATYTEPAGKRGTVKIEYNATYAPSVNNKDVANYAAATGGYTLPDTALTSALTSASIAHKGGGSYMWRTEKLEASAGANYQRTQLTNTQRLPVALALTHVFENILPSVTVRYKFSKTKSIDCYYNTGVQLPSLYQMQRVVNNADPLHLYTGNPNLKQTYQHSIVVRYYASSPVAKRTFSASVNGRYAQNNVASRSVIIATDTVIEQVKLPGGSQLTMPVNISGNSNLSANLNYGMPLPAIKCNISLSINASYSHSQSIINERLNYQDTKNAGITASVSSNISEAIDFHLSWNMNLTANANSINRQANAQYVNNTGKATVNLTLPKGIIFNTTLNYQYNTGLSAGYNQDYLLCNIAIGKKVFRKRQGDIRLTVFDALNENNNIQRSITETYIQDTRSYVLQRYYLLVFTYKLRSYIR